MPPSIACRVKTWSVAGAIGVDENFVYAIKGSRFITHMKKLVNLDGAVDKFFDRLAPLESHIGTILWQLPGMLRKDAPRLEDFLRSLPPTSATRSNFAMPHGMTTKFFRS